MRSQLHKGIFNPVKAGSSVFFTFRKLCESYRGIEGSLIARKDNGRLLQGLGEYTHHVYLYEPQENFSRSDNIISLTAINNET